MRARILRTEKYKGVRWGLVSCSCGKRYRNHRLLGWRYVVAECPSCCIYIDTHTSSFYSRQAFNDEVKGSEQGVWIGFVGNFFYFVLSDGSHIRYYSEVKRKIQGTVDDMWLKGREMANKRKSDEQVRFITNFLHGLQKSGVLEITNPMAMLENIKGKGSLYREQLINSIK